MQAFFCVFFSVLRLSTFTAGQQKGTVFCFRIDMAIVMVNRQCDITRSAHCSLERPRLNFLNHFAYGVMTGRFFSVAFTYPEICALSARISIFILSLPSNGNKKAPCHMAKCLLGLYSPLFIVIVQKIRPVVPRRKAAGTCAIKKGI